MEIIHRISSDDHLKIGKILFEIGISHEIGNEFSRSSSYLEQSLEHLFAFLGHNDLTFCIKYFNVLSNRKYCYQCGVIIIIIIIMDNNDLVLS